jgi:hypothetical protein
VIWEIATCQGLLNGVIQKPPYTRVSELAQAPAASEKERGTGDWQHYKPPSAILREVAARGAAPQLRPAGPPALQVQDHRIDRMFQHDHVLISNQTISNQVLTGSHLSLSLAADFVSYLVLTDYREGTSFRIAYLFPTLVVTSIF